MKKILSLIVASSIVTTASITAHAETRYNVSRLYGIDRYKTSINISKSIYNLANSSQYLGSEKSKILQLKQRLEKAKQYMQ